MATEYKWMWYQVTGNDNSEGMIEEASLDSTKMANECWGIQEFRFKESRAKDGSWILVLYVRDTEEWAMKKLKEDNGEELDL